MAFLKTAHASDEPASLTLTELKQGIYQVLTLELPYLTPDYREQVLALREKYRPTLPENPEQNGESSRAETGVSVGIG